MSRTVIKIGGSILESPTASIHLRSCLERHDKPVVLVVSALKGVTDELLKLAAEHTQAADEFALDLVDRYQKMARALDPASCALSGMDARLASLGRQLSLTLAGKDPDRRERVASFGERMSAVAALAAFSSLGRPASVVEPDELGLKAIGLQNDASVDVSSYAHIRDSLVQRADVVVPGFYGVGPGGRVKLLGRGGSDYSAAVIAAAIGARACVFVKDADGIRTADPCKVRGTSVVSFLTYAEASALSRGGAKVLHPRAVDPLSESGVPLWIEGLDGSGTMVATTRSVSERGTSKPLDASPGAIRAIALSACSGGTATLTLAGDGAGAQALNGVLEILDLEAGGPWSIHGGKDASAVRLKVPSARADHVLRALHAALFDRRGSEAAS